MKALKKLCAIGLSYLICRSGLGMEVKALFGNAHYSIGEKILEESKLSLSESEKKAFLSGMVYADIGKFKFDKEIKIDSDSNEFIEEMKKHTKTSEEEWFVKGFEMHVLQDEKTVEALKHISEGMGKEIDYEMYIRLCGILDDYFLKKSGSFIFNDSLDKINIVQISDTMESVLGKSFSYIKDSKNKIKVVNNILVAIMNGYYSDFITKNSLITYDGLIKETYNALGLEVSLDDIQEQTANVVGSDVFLSLLLKNVKASEDDMRESLESYEPEIELVINKLIKLCVSNLINERFETN